MMRSVYEWSRYINLSEDWIYYIGSYKDKYSIYRMNTDGSARQPVD